MSADFTRFVVFLSMIEGTKASEKIIRNHVCFLRELDKQGKLVMCGPFSDGKGGMLILKADSLEEAKRIALKDPFVLTGIRRFDVRGWELSCEENNHMGMG